MKQCKLCQQEKELQESHIIPKFVYQWMKESGTGRLRQGKTFNIPTQDGIKTKLLCKDCENELGKREKWFRENIFDGFLKRNEGELINSPELKYFTISILWRVLILFLYDGNKYKFFDELKIAEEEWRNYLHKNIPIKKYCNIHLFFVPEDIEIEGELKNIHLYFQRAVDIDIAESDTKSVVYAKFSRFVILGEICGIAEEDFVGTNIMNTEKIIPHQQIFKESEIIGFMVKRASNIKSFYDLTNRQQEKVSNFYKDKLDHIKKTDFWKVWKKDL